MNNSIISHLYLFNVETSIVSQIEEPATSPEVIIHEVSLITSHLLINMLLIDIADRDPALTTKGTFRKKE